MALGIWYKNSNKTCTTLKNKVQELLIGLFVEDSWAQAGCLFATPLNLGFGSVTYSADPDHLDKDPPENAIIFQMYKLDIYQQFFF